MSVVRRASGRSFDTTGQDGKRKMDFKIGRESNGNNLYYNEDVIQLDNLFPKAPSALLLQPLDALMGLLHKHSQPNVAAVWGLKDDIHHAAMSYVVALDVKDQLYDLCDQGQYLNAKSQCLNGNYTVPVGSANRCFFLSVLSSLKARGQFDGLTSDQAQKIKDIREKNGAPNDQVEASQEMLGQLAGICDLGPTLVAVYSAYPGTVSGRYTITHSQTLDHGTHEGHVNVAHIVHFTNHFVALVPLPRDCNPDAEEDCAPCAGRPKSKATCTATCKKTKKPCGNWRRTSFKTCRVHQADEAKSRAGKVTCPSCTMKNPSGTKKCTACDRPLPIPEKSCETCTFLNPVDAKECEMCKIPIPSV